MVKVVLIGPNLAICHLIGSFCACAVHAQDTDSLGVKIGEAKISPKILVDRKSRCLALHLLPDLYRDPNLDTVSSRYL